MSLFLSREGVKDIRKILLCKRAVRTPWQMNFTHHGLQIEIPGLWGNDSTPSSGEFLMDAVGVERYIFLRIDL